MASYSGLYDGIYNEPYSLLVSTSQLRPTQVNHLRRLMNKKQFAVLRELMIELSGTAAGAAASVTRKRIEAVAASGDPLANGGKITIETQTILSRNTTSADETTIDARLVKKVRPSYPADKSGNGGPALS